MNENPYAPPKSSHAPKEVYPNLESVVSTVFEADAPIRFGGLALLGLGLFWLLPVSPGNQKIIIALSCFVLGGITLYHRKHPALIIRPTGFSANLFFYVVHLQWQGMGELRRNGEHLTYLIKKSGLSTNFKPVLLKAETRILAFEMVMESWEEWYRAYPETQQP